MHMAIEWNKVTKLSQLVAIIIFVATFALAFYLGMTWERAHLTQPNQEQTGAPVVGAGEHCGGFIKDASVCASGFHCQLTVGRPDTGGTCVADDTSGGQGIAPYQSGITGSVMLGPTCPVERNPPDPACADKPYATLVAVFRASDPAHPFALGQSAADGSFSFDLPPGDYTLGAGESNLPQCNHPSVTVPAEGYATTTISCDTGIR